MSELYEPYCRLMRFVFTAAVSLAGAAAFQALKLPAGALLGAAVGAAAVNLLSSGAAKVPSRLSFVAFAVLGWSIGQAVTRDSLTELKNALPAIAAAVTVLMLVGAVLAFALNRWASVDAPTAYLSTSPGALAQMAALASDSGANALFVVTVHTVRLVVVVVLAPLVVRLLT
jgi:membrane AbrB-like protein